MTERNTRPGTDPHTSTTKRGSTIKEEAPNPRRILCISASPRAGGNTDSLIDRAAEGAREKGAEVEFVHLRDYAIEPCIGCEQCRRDKTCSRFYDGMHLIYPLLDASAGLVVGSPTYNYNITSLMKSFIDRLYPYFDFETPRPGPYRSRLADQGRRMVVIGVCEQNEASEMGFTIPAMRDPLEILGYELSSEVAALGHFPVASVKKDAELLRRAYAAGSELAEELT